jgi:hypothetical protein
MNEQFGYTNVQKVLIQNQKKMEQQEILRTMEKIQKEKDELDDRTALLK